MGKDFFKTKYTYHTPLGVWPGKKDKGQGEGRKTWLVNATVGALDAGKPAPRIAEVEIR